MSTGRKQRKGPAAPASLDAKRREAAWKNGLILSKEGEPKRSLANTMHVLAMHPAWDGVLAFDEFGQTVITGKEPPIREQDRPATYKPGDWTDADTVRTVGWFAEAVGFEPTATQVDQAVETIARKTMIHPVRDWLTSLKWDGVKRLDRFVPDYLGGDATPYTAAVGRCWLIAAVARVFAPGCKVDSLLCLEGSQGIGKSSAPRILAGAQWFADTGITIGDKDSYQALRRSGSSKSRNSRVSGVAPLSASRAS